MALASHGMAILRAVVIPLAMVVPLIDGVEHGRIPMSVEVLADEAGSVVLDSGSRLMRHRKLSFKNAQVRNRDPVTADFEASVDNPRSWLVRHRISRSDNTQIQDSGPAADDHDASALNDEADASNDHSGSRLMRHRKPSPNNAQIQNRDPVTADFEASVDNPHSGLMRHRISRSDNVKIREPGPAADGQDAGVDTSKYPDPHTWGDRKKNLLGLPSWVAVLFGGVIAAFIVILSHAVGNRLAHPLPFFSTEEQQLKDKIEQAREKVRLLEIALERKREQEQREAEEEARRASGEPIPSNANDDELVGEVLYRTEQVQKNVVGGVNETIKQAAPLLARASHVQSVFDHKVTEVRDRASDVAIRELGSMYQQMHQATADEGLADTLVDASHSDIRSWFILDDANDLDPPPFALLLGGMFAPAQIKAVRSQCNTQIIWTSVILATCAACLVIDMHHTCNDRFVMTWFFGLLSINVLDIFCCAFIASKCATQLTTLHDQEESMSHIRSTGNSVWDMYVNMRANSGQFFKGYFAYQSIIDGTVYNGQKVCSIFTLMWGCLGVYLSIAHIMEDTLSCDAKVSVWFMHVYSGFFLILSTWTLLALFLWVVQRLSHSIAVITPLMKAAKKSDEEVPFNFPLFQTITRSFILRDSSTMLRIKARGIAQDVDDKEAAIQDMKRRLEDQKYTLKHFEGCRIAAVKHEADMIEKYKNRVRTMGGTLPDEVSAAEAALHSEAGSSSLAFGTALTDSAALGSAALSDFANLTRGNFATAAATVNVQDGLDGSDGMAVAALIQAEVQAAADVIGQAAAQAASASAQVVATPTAESSLQQPLLQEDVFTTELEASASSTPAHPAQDTENQPESS